MRLKNVHIGLLMLIFSSFTLFAQEKSDIRGELNFIYSHILGGKSIGLGGYGADFYSTLTPLARFANPDEIWAKQPLFNLGLEGNLILKPLYSNESIILSPTLSYSLRYSQEHYHINYDINDTQNPIVPGTIGGRGSQEDITLHALTNHLNFGVRLDRTQSLLYTNLSIGVLFYTPIGLKWIRQAYDADGNPVASVSHSVWMGQKTRITDALPSQESGPQILSLGGTSEILFNIGAKVGYGPIFAGVNYATNIRVNVVSFDIGLTLHPFARSNN